MLHEDAVDRDADEVGIHVEQRRDGEPAAAEAAVARERVAEVADADEGDGLVVVEPQRLLQLVTQRTHLVPDTADAVGADVGQVLAQLGGVDAGGRGQLLARHRLGALLGELAQHPQVDRQPGDAGLGDHPGTVGRVGVVRPLRNGHGLPLGLRRLTGGRRTGSGS